MTPELPKVLQRAITRRNDRYLEELREVLEERCGVKVSDATIWRTLHRVGFRLKEVSFPFTFLCPLLTAPQITKHAAERNEFLRAQYRCTIGEHYKPEQLVFVDESACDRRTYLRNRVWALEGLRACRKQYFARGKRYVDSQRALRRTDMVRSYSILPAITLDGVIECHIIEGSFNTELFMRFIEDLTDKMEPFPARNSVVVMDNCKIHKSPEIREFIESK